jgi:hypothetical protein
MMKMSGLVSPDKWAAFALSVPGLVVSALSVSDLMACLRLIGARQEMIIFIRKKDVSTGWLRIVSARTISLQGVDVESK